MRLSDLDLDARVTFSPSPDEMLHFPKPLDLGFVSSVLTDFEATIRFHKRIRNAELELQLAEVALRESEFKHEQFLETQGLDREAAEQARKRARQDHDHFVRVDRD